MNRAEAIKIVEKERDFRREMQARWSEVKGKPFDHWPSGNKNLADAFDMALAALREQEQRQWISVKERLPEVWKTDDGNLANYLVYMPEYGVDVGNYARPAKVWVCMGIPCKVTHWMTLPEPPEGGAEE